MARRRLARPDADFPDGKIGNEKFIPISFVPD